MCLETSIRPRAMPRLTLPGPLPACSSHPGPLPARSSHPGPLPARRLHRGPQVFTFDLEERETVAPRKAPAVVRNRRSRRVLYPAQARRYLPSPRPDWALRCLYLLCLALLLQICWEEVVEDGILLPAKLEHIEPAVQSPGLLQNLTCLPLRVTLSWLHQQR